MPLGNNITNVLKGSTQVDRILKGSTVVWENFKPITSVVKRGFSATGADNSSYTFSGMAIGSESSDRWVAVCIGSQTPSGNQSIASVTIGGVAASIYQRRYDGVNDTLAAVAYAKVPTGTTASVVVGFNKTVNNCGVQVLTFSGGASLAVVDSVNTGSTGTSLTCANVQCAEGGLVISCACGVFNGSMSHSWNGVDTAVAMTNGVVISDTIIRHGSHYVTATENSTARDARITASVAMTIGSAMVSVSLLPS